MGTMHKENIMLTPILTGLFLLITISQNEQIEKEKGRALKIKFEIVKECVANSELDICKKYSKK
jgi:hypothetical protein